MPLQKVGWTWKGFKEGLSEEGIPLGGAALGAAIGGAYGHGLTGAALGYATGGGASLLKSKLRREKPSATRRILAGSALGYGLGGLGHAGLSFLTRNAHRAGLRNIFHGTGALKSGVEELFPAIGGTLGAAITKGREKKASIDNQVITSFLDELQKITADGITNL